MIWGGYEPTPPRPGSLDDALARGFDVDSVRHDRSTPEPLTPEWQDALDRSLEIVRHMRCGVEDCGEIRCDTCRERMTCTGPEPRACGTTCGDCPCPCVSCAEAAQDYQDDRAYQIARDDR